MKKSIRSYMAGLVTALVIFTVFDAGAGDILTTLDVVVNKVNISQDGNLITLADTDYVLPSGETVPYSLLYKGTTYLPARTVAELLGKEVGWEGDYNLVTIDTPNPTVPVDLTFVKEQISSITAGTSNANAPVEVPAYDYSKPVPESAAVGDDYFEDSVFLGNSLIVGLMGYSGIQGAENLGVTSLTVYNVTTEKNFEKPNGTKINALEKLALKQYKKVYVLFGINEIGGSKFKFIEEYTSIINKIKELQPNAKIYIQSILPVTAKLSGSDQYFNNPRIEQYNEAIKAMTEDLEVYYVNVAETFKDKDGALPSTASWDKGVHLNASQYKIWLTYLKSHTVE